MKVAFFKETPYLQHIKYHPSKAHTLLLGDLLLNHS